MNTPARKSIIASLFVLFCLAAQPMMAQTSDLDLVTQEIVVNITDTKDGHTSTIEKTFSTEAEATAYLFNNGYGETALTTSKDVGVQNREVKVSTRAKSSKGLINADGTANLRNIVYYPANATITTLADGSKEITWTEVDEDGDTYPVRTVVKVHKGQSPKF